VKVKVKVDCTATSNIKHQTSNTIQQLNVETS